MNKSIDLNQNEISLINGGKIFTNIGWAVGGTSGVILGGITGFALSIAVIACGKTQGLESGQKKYESKPTSIIVVLSTLTGAYFGAIAGAKAGTKIGAMID